MFKNKTLLITGGTGSFGNAVLNHFINSELKEIRIFSRDEKKQEDMRILLKNKKINFFVGDVRDFESIKAMFFNNPDSAYKILEIEKTASSTEIKKAYRTMVKKYHPDKLQHMDEVYRKGAEQKFRRVQEAYEQLQKERGF